MIPVHSRMHRTLRKLAAFEVLTSSRVEYPTGTVSPALAPGEEVLGIYRNGPSGTSEDILVTSIGLRTGLPRECTLLRFDEIVEVVLPHAEDKEVVDTLRLRLHSGEFRELPVRGGAEQFRDAWEFLHFLQRVVSDAGRRNSRG